MGFFAERTAAHAAGSLVATGPRLLVRLQVHCQQPGLQVRRAAGARHQGRVGRLHLSHAAHLRPLARRRSQQVPQRAGRQVQHERPLQQLVAGPGPVGGRHEAHPRGRQGRPLGVLGQLSLVAQLDAGARQDSRAAANRVGAQGLPTLAELESESGLPDRHLAVEHQDHDRAAQRHQGQHQALVLANDGRQVQRVQEARKVQEAALLSLLLPLDLAREKEVLEPRLERQLQLQRLGL